MRVTKRHITEAGKVFDYIYAVTKKQERLLDKDTLYFGYSSVFPDNTRFNKVGFDLVYDSYKEAIQ